MSDICPVCKGSGNIFTTAGGFKWWVCGVCHGSGVTVQYGPAAYSQKPAAQSKAKP